MNTLPSAFIERIRKQLKEEADDFLTALGSESPISVRLNPGKLHSIELLPEDWQIAENIPWCENGFYLSQRPVFTLDPLFHGGAYYVQEASSMFLHHVLQQVLPPDSVRILDLCAAPGGKSTLMASQLPAGSLLVANEVIRTRANILKENIIKWGHDNIVVTQNDPADFKELKSAFDVIVVDAPCSGEGMFRKDPEAIHEWSENNLRICSERQKRILSSIWPSLKPGGCLIYSTCTYNPEENEKILEWLVNEKNAESIEIKHNYPSVTYSSSEVFGYHFYPHKSKGEGFFIGAVRKTNGQESTLRKNKKNRAGNYPQLPKSIETYIKSLESYTAYQQENNWGVVPSGHADFVQQLSSELRILYQGCELAEVNNRKIKWLPGAALWENLNTVNCCNYDIDLSTALTFLKKEDIPPPALQDDWLRITYRGVGLGWCKHLGTRLNNYYPKEWRIRMRVEGKG